MNIKKLSIAAAVLLAHVCAFAANAETAAKAQADAELFTDISISNGPYVHGITDDSATVVWCTDQPAVSWVEIAPADGSHFYAQERKKFFQAPLGRKLVGTMHTVRIDGLKPATTYNFRIFSRKVAAEVKNRTYYGAVASSKVYKKAPLKLRTLDASKKEINFAVVNDIHEHSDELKKLLEFVPKSADFLLLNGDMTNYMGSREQMFKGYLNVISEFVGKTGMPMFMAIGNHETRGAISHEFMNYFPTPTNKPYYTFRVGPAFFVVLDSGEDKPDNDVEYSDRSDFDNYRQRQAEWFKGVVKSKEYAAAPVKILIVHVPPAWGSWHGSKHFQKCFAEAINNAGLSAIISAHTHKFMFFDGKEGIIKTPNVINAARELMNVNVNTDKLTFSFFNTEGKKTRGDIVLPVVK